MSRLACMALVLIVGSAAAQTAPPAIFLPPVVPPGLKVLTQPAVQADVGLTAAQRTEIKTLNDLWGQSAGASEGLSVVWVSPGTVRSVIVQRTQEFLTKNLTKEQPARLDQIVFQLREKEFGSHAAFAMAAGDLGLRSDQIEDVQNLKGLRVEEIVKHVTSGERYEKIKDKVAATNGETFEKMAEMLTRTQRERLKELRGKPFAGALQPSGAIAGTDKGGQTVLAYPAELFGVYDYEIRYLDNLIFRRELGIRDDQTGSITRAIQAWDSEYQRQTLSIKTVGSLHEKTSKALAEVLTEKQRKRFDELMAGRRRVIGGYEAACGYPSVVARLKLSPIQLEELKEGKTIDEVLTKAQAETLRELVSETFELATNVVDPLRERAAEAERKRRAREDERPATFARALLALSKRLDLSEDQVKKLRDLAEDEPKVKDLIRRELSLTATPPVAGAGRGLTVDRAVIDKYQAAVEEQCWNVLDPPQQSLARKIFGRGGR